MEMTIYSQNYVTKEVKAYQKQLGKAVNVNLNDLKGVKSLEVVTFEGYKNVLGDFSPLLIVKDIEGNFYNVHMEEMNVRNWKSNLYSKMKQYNVFIKDLFDSLVIKF